ncbi:GMC oxidoreductase [Hypholoma sublateritium FD-334 SS-4]|uniref:pyranose dehydrogenase (acceptor) n=1 Tax=Hypholoma sublateritium (strain FD-334 SS-4) TaxID=945553 RepID=A0A0D2LSH9_HYPSF|nr:GMC oxidoreductase [Hypholoma sublateritium FD-334 SS-4]
MTAPAESKNEYDIIFVGGGTTACLVAGRLSRADRSLKILVLEAGPHTKDVAYHVQPAQFTRHVLPGSTTTKVHNGKPSCAVGGRALPVHTAQCFGGGSAVNFLMYNRASASDYDDWETKYSNPGWGSKDLIPLLRKAETYQVNGGLPSHGYSGPLKVSLGGHYDISAQQFVEIGPKVEKNRPSSDECNTMGADSINVFARLPRWIDRETGKRQDTAHIFIYNQSENKNLELLDGCRVKRVIIENRRAVGVEFVDDKIMRPSTDSALRTARASKMVVISAGALGSPAVLERSGIGAADRLEKLRIPVIVDLPGVGENYQDHMLLSPSYFVGPGIETAESLIRGNPKSEENVKLLERWNKDGTGILGSNGVDAAIKMRPREDELGEIGPEFATRWKDFFENAPDKPIVWMKGSPRLPATDLAKQLGLPPTNFLSGSYFVTYPDCRGNAHITSDDAYAPLEFDSGFMTKMSDIVILRWAYKHSREIIRRLPVYRGAVPQMHPKFPEGSCAVTTEEVSPVDLSSPRITYTAEDDAAIDEYHRRTGEPTLLGTCAMKPRQSGGVVDPRLNVYGVEGLKVADVSIPPSNVNANTYSTAVAIGEKAALIILQELGINTL